jgi:hypothetical protein
LLPESSIAAAICVDLPNSENRYEKDIQQDIFHTFCRLGAAFEQCLAQSTVANRMKEHIVYLSSDQLEGRETGKKG